MKCFIYCLIAIFMAPPIWANSHLNELKIGIYAKDFKKIYENLDLHFSGDINNTNPQKWIEVGDMLVEIKDYASAWQFYLHSTISLFQNETFSKREKSDIFATIIDKSEKMLKSAGPMDNLLIQKNKYSIYPGKTNVFNVLSIMLRDAERNILSVPPPKMESPIDDAPVDLNISEIVSSVSQNELVFTQAKPEYDQSPYYDYSEINSFLSYPRRAYQEGIEGKVILDLLIDEKGNIEEKKIFESSNRIFDEHALSVVDKIRFMPATRMGAPFKCRIKVPIHFTLSNK